MAKSDIMTTFNMREMQIINAIVEGDCAGSRMTEGGDYTYRCWNNGLSQDEMDEFLRKLHLFSMLRLLDDHV
jgi:hypothetical protein